MRRNFCCGSSKNTRATRVASFFRRVSLSVIPASATALRVQLLQDKDLKSAERYSGSISKLLTLTLTLAFTCAPVTDVKFYSSASRNRVFLIDTDRKK